MPVKKLNLEDQVELFVQVQHEVYRLKDQLNHLEYVILSHLKKHGRATPTEMKRKFDVSAPYISRSLGSLLAIGLVEFSEVEQDRRSLVYRLTEAGRRAIEDYRAAISEIISDQRSKLKENTDG